MANPFLVFPKVKKLKIDLVPAYNYYVDLTDLDNKIKNFRRNTKIKIPTQSEKIFNLYDRINRETQTPKSSLIIKSFTNQEVKLDIDGFESGGFRHNYISTAMIESFDIRFYPENSNLAKILYYSWACLMINFENGTRYPRNNYLTDIAITIYDRHHQFVEKKTLHGCFPQSFSATELNKSMIDYVGEYTMNLVVSSGMTFKYSENR